jgi:hypothetical protein
VRGVVKDTSASVVPEAAVSLENTATNVKQSAKTNKDGLYFFGSLLPGTYRVKVSRDGFKPAETPALELRAGDIIPVDITLELGSASASVTVTDEPPIVQSESGAVRTVISGALANQLPLNGQTLQPLLSLAPGAVYLPTNYGTSGDFSINGQRSTSNYYQVDGLSANVGTYAGRTVSTALNGALPGVNVAGSTSALASVESVREIQVQTSSLAPEFGGASGGQISLVTKSGTLDFHGSAYGYIRNEFFNASDWFANASALPKPRSRLRTLGATLGGPADLWHERKRRSTFFFLSYEGQDLAIPQARIEPVPTLSLRTSVAPILQPVLQSFGEPNGAALSAISAQHRLSYSDSLAAPALAARIDSNPSGRIHAYFRFSHAPSHDRVRDASNGARIDSDELTNDAVSGGITATINSRNLFDLRANYSVNEVSSIVAQDSIDGAKPYDITALIPNMPELTAAATSNFSFNLPDHFGAALGKGSINSQHQIQAVPTWTTLLGSHTLKFGADWRRLSPVDDITPTIILSVTSLASALAGKVDSLTIGNGQKLVPVFHQISSFAQDEWRLSDRLKLIYGFRWEISPAPQSSDGTRPATLTDLTDLTVTSLKFADSLYPTQYTALAPRAGLAWKPLGGARGLVLRGGAGLFYDTGGATIGDVFRGFPYAFSTTFSSLTLPLALNNVPAYGTKALQPPFPPITIIDPSFTLPRVVQWNVAMEDGLSRFDTVSLTYAGAAGDDLVGTQKYIKPNPFFSSSLSILSGYGSSTYHSLQFQFEHRLGKGIQALAGYTWSHSIDTVSNDSYNSSDKASSAFDVRQKASFALAGTLPQLFQHGWAEHIFGGWSIYLLGRFQSAPPLDVYASGDVVRADGTSLVRRPNLVYGIPLWIYNPNFAGGRALNPSAFQLAAGGAQGNLGRNAIRGFAYNQVDLSVSKDLVKRDKLKISLRADAFNLLNHPVFAQPQTNLLNSLFGRSTSLLSGLSQNSGSSLNSQYQMGAPRSIQFSLRLAF